MKLTQEQIEHYNSRGYVHPIDLYSDPADVQTMQDRFQQCLDMVPPGRHVKELGNWHATNTWVYEMASHPNLLDAVESLIGPDFMCWGAMVFYKEPQKDQVIRWHQGPGIWPLKSGVGASLAGFDTRNGSQVGQIPTALVGISDLTIANGCLKLIPGSHYGDVLPHTAEKEADREKYLFENSIEDHHVDTSQVGHSEVKAGQFSIHHGMVVHASGPNETDGFRCGLAIRYATWDIVFDSVEWPQVWTIPMRGTNKFGTKHWLVPPPTEFRLPTLADLPHLDARLSSAQRLGRKLKRATRRVFGAA